MPFLGWKYASTITFIAFAALLPLASAPALPDLCRSQGSKVCVPITQCPSVLADISSTTFTMLSVRRLQKITCGFEGQDPKFCCPEVEVARSRTRLQAHLDLLPLEECGRSAVTTTDYIIGGTTPAIGTLPWITRIGHKGVREADFFCGGSLINHNFVLTAAHCILEMNPQRYVIQIGEPAELSPLVHFNSSVLNYDVTQIIVHPDYNSTTKANDIALIQLGTDVDFTPFVKPVCLPLAEKYNVSQLLVVGLESGTRRGVVMGEVGGFGKTSNHHLNQGSPVLQLLTLPIVKNKDCAEVYKGKTSITQAQICAGGLSGQDSCDGDSGGSLTIHDAVEKRSFQVGIVSFGPSLCGSEGYPGIYTRVSAYLDWILHHLHTNSTSPQ